MTNLKSTTKTLNTLNTLLAIFIFAFAANTTFAQVVEPGTFADGINKTDNGITIKSAVGGVSNFLLINPAQELLGGFQARKYGNGQFASGLLDVNKKFFLRHTTGFVTDFNINDNIMMRVWNDGKVTIGNVQNVKDANGLPTVPRVFLEAGYGSVIGADKYKLIVQTGILTEKVKVAGLETSDWADYVFEEDYEMLSIDELEDYVTENKHLPNVPSAQEVAENGLDLAKTDATLLEKIEESYLYIIELNKKFDALEAENNNLKSDIKVLQSSQN